MPTASINSVRVGEIDDDDDSENEWDPEVTTYEYIDIHINAARTEDKKPTAPAWREPIKSSLKEEG